MKINTKKCTNVLKDSETCCKVNTSNPFIPKDKEEQEEKEDDYGREMTYVPDVIFTPTLSSKRTNPKPYPRLTEEAMEELSTSISTMLISDKEPKDEKPKDKKSRAKDPVSPPLGRYEVEVFTESKSIVRVSRSLRLT